ncbi:unnamed protein product, partial [Schistosoma mattheei]
MNAQSSLISKDLNNNYTGIDSSQSKTIDLLPDIDEQQQFNQNNHINLPIIETIQGLNELP